MITTLDVNDKDKVAKINWHLKWMDCWVMPFFDSLNGVVTPPTDPEESVIYIVGANATGDWLGKDGQWAYYIDDQWYFESPMPYNHLFNDADGIIYYWDGAAFVKYTG